MKSQTVVFGPFIGEFGWELLFWQGWVRKACRQQFADFRKIAISAPGRQPFYPDTDEFWPLPESYLRLQPSGHAYYTDAWRGGYPGEQVRRYTVRSVLGPLSRMRTPFQSLHERPIDALDVEPRAEAMLSDFRRLLPEDTIWFVPWKTNRVESDGLEFGVHIPAGALPTKSLARIQRISFEHQILEHLDPTEYGESLFREVASGDRSLIALFPRHRNLRRADKNWSRAKYSELVQVLQQLYPSHKVAIFGEPGGAHFADSIPDGCLDLINVPPERRMDIQIAALKRSHMALGSMSGAMLVALASGCPALIWGFPQAQARYHRENFMGTPMIYHADMDPEVNRIVDLTRSLDRMLGGWRSLDRESAASALEIAD